MGERGKEAAARRRAKPPADSAGSVLRRSAQLTAGATMAGVRATETGVRELEERTPTPVRDIIGKGMDLVLAVDRGLAGAIQEVHYEKKGRTEGPMALPKAIARGIRQKTSYRDTDLPKPVATGLDLIAPGSYLFPYGRLAKGVKGAVRAGNEVTGAVIDVAASHSPAVAAVKDTAVGAAKDIRGVVDLQYKIKHKAIEAGATPEAAEQFAGDALWEMRKHAASTRRAQGADVPDEIKTLDNVLKDEASMRRVQVALDADPREILPVENPHITKLDDRVRRLKRIEHKLNVKVHDREMKMKAIFQNTEDLVGAERGKLRMKSTEDVYAALDEIPDKKADLEARLQQLVKEREDQVRWVSARAHYHEMDPNQLPSVLERRPGATPKTVVKATRAHDEFVRSIRAQIQVKNDEIAAVMKELKGLPILEERLWREGERLAAGPFKGRTEITLERRLKRENRTIRELQAEKKAIRKRIEKHQVHARSLAEEDARHLADRNLRNERQWQSLMKTLSPEEKEAYAIAQVFSNQTEIDKLAGGVLKETTAAGFEQRHGTGHLARQLNEKDAAVAAIDEAIAEHAAQGKSTYSLLEMRHKINQIAPSRWDWLTGRAGGKTGKRIKQAGFLKERKTRKLADMGPLVGVYDPNLPRLLHMDRINTNTAKLDRAALLEIQDMAMSTGIAKTEKEALAAWGDNVQKYPSYYEGLRDDLYVPKDIARELFAGMQRYRDTEETVRTVAHVFDVLMADPWRRIALFTNPAFYARNIVGSTHNAWTALGMGTDAIPDYVWAGKRTQRWHRGKFEPGEREFMEHLQDNAILGVGQSKEGRRLVSHSQPGFVSKYVLPSSENKALGWLADHMQGGIEDTMRLAAFHYLKRKNPTWSIRQISEKVNLAHFDYVTGLTSFERSTMLRLFPFYRWTRYNMPLQLQMIAAHPERYAAVLRRINTVQTMTGGPQPDERVLPDYLAEDSHMRILYDEETGDFRIVRLPGWLPLGDIDKVTDGGKFVREAFNMLYPFMKDVPQVPFNIDLFRSDPGDFGKGDRARLVPLWDTQREYQLLGKDINPVLLHFLETYVPPVGTANRVHGEFQKGGAKSATLRTFFGAAYPVHQADNYTRYYNKVNQKIRDVTHKLNTEKDPNKRRRLEERRVELINERADVYLNRPAVTYRKNAVVAPKGKGETRTNRDNPRARRVR